MHRLFSFLRTRFSRPRHRGVRFVAHAAWAPDLVLARRAAIQSFRPSASPPRATSVNGRSYLAWWLVFRRVRTLAAPTPLCPA